MARIEERQATEARVDQKKPVDIYASIGARVDRVLEVDDRAPEFSITQEELIGAVPWGLRHLAEPWLKMPAGWEEMTVSLISSHFKHSDAYYSVLVRNIGADAG